MIDHHAVATVLLGNLRTMCDEIEELLAAPAQADHGLVRNQLEFVSGKLEMAVAYAAHGAGMVASDAPPPGPTLGEMQATLMRQIDPDWKPRGVAAKAPGRSIKRKAKQEG